MVRNWQQGLGQLAGIAIAVGFTTTTPSSKLRAQITPDASLGTESSVVKPDLINGLPSDRIEGGAIRGSNLFHSFQKFNIGEGRAAYFSNPEAIENIFSRVTGSNPSQLRGTLGVLGDANLFFLNPNGILFGPNARLDLRGSFFATTADSLLFANGNEFSAINPQAPPLLTVNVQQPIGLQFEGNPGTIINQSKATNSSGQVVGLQMQPEQSLGLLGGDIKLEGGVLTASGGQIELGAVAVGNQVSLDSTDSGLALGYEGVENFEDIQLSQQANINTSGEGGGKIQLQGENVTLTQGSSLVAETLGTLDGVGIDIQVGQFRLSDESFISSLTLGSGRGGNLTIQGRDSLELIGTGFDNFEQTVLAISSGTLSPSDLRKNGIFAGTASIGPGGDIAIDTPSLILREGAFIFNPAFSEGEGGSMVLKVPNSVEFTGSGLGNFTLASGAAGDLTIETSQLLVRDGAVVINWTLNEGTAGDLTVKSSESVEVVLTPEDSPFATSISAITIDGPGKGGNVTIETERLLLDKGGRVSTSTFGLGNAGDLTVLSKSVEIIGTTPDGLIPSGLFAQVNPEGNSGNGGDLRIETERLLVGDGAQLSTSTFGNGDAGDLTILAESVEVIGFSTRFLTTLATAVESKATGDGGQLKIETDRLLVADGAQIGTSTFGEGKAGNLSVTAESVELIGTDGFGFPSGLFANVQKQAIGNGGNLTVETESLLVKDGAAIAANTLGVGNAGELTITTQTVEVSGISETDARRSSLLANVREGATGNGGNLTVETESLIMRDGGLVSVATEGAGRTGNLTLNIQDSLLLSGQETGIFGNTTEGSTSDGGNIFLDSPTVIIENGAKIAVDSQGTGVGGNIFGTAGTLNLDKGTISAETASNTGGNIELQVRELLLLRNGSQISTTAGTAGAGGDGGNIGIDSDFIIAFPSENSDITANAFTGSGGRVQITANGIFGIEPRVQLTPLSDITASSTFGLTGIVEINTPDLDPNRGLTKLPEEATEVEVAEGCQAGDGQEAVAFFNLGRGGIPPSPYDPLRSETIITPWIPLVSEEEKKQEQAKSEQYSTEHTVGLRRTPCRKK